LSVRLQKFLADAGVASRRAGEQFILEGRVSVNGDIVRLLGTKVDPAHDRVQVDGKPVREKRKIYVALHKPVRYVCSHKDELGRATIYELLPKEWGAVSSVGRLDFTQGIFDGGEKLKAMSAHLISGSRAKSVVEMELAEGKNREVRRMFESQNLTVKRLQRTQIGKIKLGELKMGKWRTLTETEIKTLISDL